MILKTYHIINTETKEIEICSGSNRAKAKRELQQIRKEQPDKNFKIVLHTICLHL